MPHTDEAIAEAARRFEELADDLDPETATPEPIDDRGQIAAVSEAVRADEAGASAKRAAEARRPSRSASPAGWFRRLTHRPSAPSGRGIS